MNINVDEPKKKSSLLQSDSVLTSRNGMTEEFINQRRIYFTAVRFCFELKETE
jgi:hypothetical protein